MIIHRRVGFICASMIALLVWSMIVFQSCNSAAASPIVLYDTAKPQVKIKPVVTRYVLTGSDTLFSLMWRTLTSPDDVTPNEKKKVLTWINDRLRPDTTSIK